MTGWRARVCLSWILAFSLATPARAEKSETKSRASNEKMTATDEGKETKLSYPELEVTPRASERLEIEAKRERRSRWGTHLPIQFSALATMYAAGNVKSKDNLSDKAKDDFSLRRQTATGVGAGWLVITLALSSLYTPYYTGLREISKLPKSNQREELTRERLAEEALYAPSGLATKLKWFSVASQLFVTASLQQNSPRESLMVIGVGVLSSFVPLLFEPRWSAVADQHRQYKKKIYGPIASTTLLPVNDREFTPGLGLQWTF